MGAGHRFARLNFTPRAVRAVPLDVCLLPVSLADAGSARCASSSSASPARGRAWWPGQPCTSWWPAKRGSPPPPRPPARTHQRRRRQGSEPPTATGSSSRARRRRPLPGRWNAPCCARPWRSPPAPAWARRSTSSWTRPPSRCALQGSACAQEGMPGRNLRAKCADCTHASVGWRTPGTRASCCCCCCAGGQLGAGHAAQPVPPAPPVAARPGGLGQPVPPRRQCRPERWLWRLDGQGRVALGGRPGGAAAPPDRGA